MQNAVLPEPLDQVRRTVAQEQGVVLTSDEFKRDFPGVVRALDLPSSVHDVLNGASDYRVQNRPWLRVSQLVTNAVKP